MYNIAIALYAFFVRLVSPFHKKARRMVSGQRDTFRILREKIIPGEKYVWIHAASLGEFEQARPIIETVKGKMPEYKILLTFFSPSGYEVRKNYPLADIVCYLPFDTKRNVTRFLELAKPYVAVFVKYELWYNFIHESYLQRIPVYLVSAVFRPEQPFFHKGRGKYGKMLRFYTHIFVQDEHSKELLEAHQIRQVTVTGDTRIDRVMDVRKESLPLPLVERFIQADNPKTIFIAGSSWEPDEDIFIDYFNSHPDMKMIVAPHEIDEDHLIRIEKKIKRPVIRYSGATLQNIQRHDCVIIDCFGLLSSMYRYGDIAYVGGGFGVGIHNLLEAAVWGIPVIFGPNFVKFREAYDLIYHGGGFSIDDKDSFNERMDGLLRSSESIKAAGKKAEAYIFSNGGATQKIIDIIGLD
ncbi:MAG TPA: 3-deoxy-D-manno-octulosonic acid transferase [Porphyromonadaceae bacterium]|jgi:3-deoxy-D-manno-octulosonic-acid transferase|nr:3-deoxy-D-manno-octulosonic acid transferase [Porphyromonadaceae bacterium]HBX21635.1 3-deoxy-D-manno-octulosonic acid transferase [Porphyromonadaceae bacterium]HCM19689.1 3-deoxy-D-manno-octulosonic acid transferase [Porphyromonadaceae bacterium]